MVATADLEVLTQDVGERAEAANGLEAVEAVRAHRPGEYGDAAKEAGEAGQREKIVGGDEQHAARGAVGERRRLELDGHGERGGDIRSLDGGCDDVRERAAVEV